MKTFNMSRPAVAALGLGMAQAAIDFTRDALAEEGITVDYGLGLSSRSALQHIASARIVVPWTFQGKKPPQERGV